MRAYRFKVRKGTEIEELGLVGLADDDEALAVAKQVILDHLADEDAEKYSGWAVDITETGGDRKVSSLPFEM